MQRLRQKIQESIAAIRAVVPQRPQIAVILGSGLGECAQQLPAPSTIYTADIPHFPETTVEGHAGKWRFCSIQGISVLMVMGRAHFYEGYSIAQIGYPLQVLAALGVKILIVTSAAGGINLNYAAGDIMIVSDHINLGFANPLIGALGDIPGSRVPDMSEPYDRQLMALAEETALKLAIATRRGVFCWLSGPTYETRAEIRMLRTIGVDAVGMSIVPEALVARGHNIRILGLSCISNVATTSPTTVLSHRDVLHSIEQVRPRFCRLVQEIIVQLATSPP